MINKILISILVSVFLISNSFAAGSSDSGSSKTKTQYDMALSHIKSAKQLEKKRQIRKSKKKIRKSTKIIDKIK